MEVNMNHKITLPDKFDSFTKIGLVFVLNVLTAIRCLEIFLTAIHCYEK